MRKLNQFDNIRFCFNRIHDYSEIIFQTPEIQNLLRSNSSYDLVIGNLFYLDPFLSFGYRFDAPVIGLAAQTTTFHDWLLGNPFPASYVPHIYLPLSEKMSFFERLINTGYNFLTGTYVTLFDIYAWIDISGHSCTKYSEVTFWLQISEFADTSIHSRLNDPIVANSLSGFAKYCKLFE